MHSFKVVCCYPFPLFYFLIVLLGLKVLLSHKFKFFLPSFSKMNYSSLFSFGETSAWDPKELRKRLIVSQDQLIKLNSMPGKI